MIIKCVNCNKKFNVDQNLIPEKGRMVQCGSCNFSWHYQIKKLASKTIALNEKNNQEENKILENHDSGDLKNYQENNVKNKSKIEENIVNEIIIKQKKEKNTSSSSKSFSYLIVFIVSVIALIIFVDTLKSPLINIFPGLEIVLFNFFETLKDIRLFIIDLTQF